MEFKIGDRVRVKRGLKVWELYGGLTLQPYMDRMRCGIVVESTGWNEDSRAYKADNGFWYTEEMLELIDMSKLCNRAMVAIHDLVQKMKGATQE